MLHQAATLPTIGDPVPTESIEPLQILTLNGVTWDQYVTICDALPDHPGLRTAFDGNALELMTTSYSHEWLKKYLSRLFETLTLELGIDTRPGGNTTFRREDLAKGLEPDECYWIANEARMRPLHDWDPERDPPPDLAIEIDVSRSSVNRQSIYSELGTKELWRYDGTTLKALGRLETGEYEPLDESAAIPGLRVEDFMPFIRRLESERETVVLRDFIEWVRETLK